MNAASKQLQSPHVSCSTREGIERKASFWISYLEEIIPQGLLVKLDPPKGLRDEELSEDEKRKLEPRMGVHVKSLTGEMVIEGIIRMTEVDEDAIDVADQSTTYHLSECSKQSRAFFVLDEKVRFFVIEDEDRRAFVPVLDPQQDIEQIRVSFEDCCRMNA